MHARSWCMACLLAGLLAMAGCSSLTVNYDYDAEATFSDYRTYAWIGTAPAQVGDAAQAKMRNDLLDSRIRSAVDWQMEQRGLKPKSDIPDLLVVYHVGTQNKVQVSDWGYSYSPYYRGYGGRQLDVTQYTEGTLLIDLIDAKTKRMVWRGSGSGVLDSRQKTPDQIQADIDDAVAQIMESYPPK